MARIIASTYEVQRELGSGGGGIVYLARHLRLGKEVVLKADKRTLTARPEVLRREVDALKNLSHTYIPQVYDFLEEDGVVYTVMDYIEGESLDRSLARGEHFAQPQVIRWALQLLEALCYLHSRPPHGILHGDIKPANIMRTPEGDIRLIDFNIALILGEKGAVKVGFSRGYASPEHYGLDYSGLSETREAGEKATTQLAERPGIAEGSDSLSRSRSSRAVLLDVRSDIYSLGATLYHLFSGRRPAPDAKDVEPLTGCSPQVAAIVAKAMAPDPARRYQTAEEMRQAFLHLHENDPRTRRHRRRAICAALVCVAAFLAGGTVSFVGLKQMEQRQSAYALAEYSARALQNGNVGQALEFALQALPEPGIFTAPYTPQAQKALTDALGVYDLTDGFRPTGTLELPSEPFDLILSPGGSRGAALYAYAVRVFDSETGETQAVFPLEPSALSDAVFSGEDILIYAGEGGVRAYDLEVGEELWAGGPATCLSLSADGSTVAAVHQGESVAVVYDTATGKMRAAIPMGKSQETAYNTSLTDPEDNLFALNGDGTRLAVSFADGSLTIFDVYDEGNHLEIYDTSAFYHFEGGFYGPYFAFSAYDGETGAFAVVDMDTFTQTGGFASALPFLVQADEQGVCLATENLAVKLDPVTGEQMELAYTEGDITGFVWDGSRTLAVTENGAVHFFDQQAREMDRVEMGVPSDFLCLAGERALVGSRNTPFVRRLELETHTQAQIAVYDPSYLHDEARLSADGNTVMLFRYDGFRLCALDGTVIREVNLPDPEQVYDQQYRREDGTSRLEVTYYDGTVRTYSAATGELLNEIAGEAPDSGLYEEFYTEKLRIASPLHEAPVAYDRTSGKRIRTLEQDAYLTYVTQTGPYVITEYISSQGERYGLLLNEACETLARLPALCDVVGDTLIFDDGTGSLRSSRIYSIEELLSLAQDGEN